MSTDPAVQRPARPGGVLVIAGILLLEGVALGVLAVVSILTIFTAPLSPSVDRPSWPSCR